MALAKEPSDSNREGKKSFWNPVRVALTLLVSGSLAAFSLSSCNSNEVTTNTPANRSANGTNTNNKASAPPNTVNNAPAAFVNLPPNLRDAKLQTIDGEALKLSDYADKVVVVN